jgi:phospholipid/cholesterol/gamma-HCH transport system permease protein
MAMPVLAVAMEVSAVAGAWCVTGWQFGVNSAHFQARVLTDVTWWSFGFGLTRTAVFGAAIALIAYSKGAEEKRGTEAVGHATTEAVVAASLAVIFLDFVMTLLASAS